MADTFALSGTLRFWNDDDAPPRELELDRVIFTYETTYEPSLIVEEVYLAWVGSRAVRYSEYDGGMGTRSWSGRAIKVEGFRHAALVNWRIHRGERDDGAPQRELVDHSPR